MFLISNNFINKKGKESVQQKNTPLTENNLALEISWKLHI